MPVTPAVALRALPNTFIRPVALLAMLILVPMIGATTGGSFAVGQVAELTVEDLRQGGYVIFFRHVLADDGVDEAPVDLQDCRTQRNIREQGLRDARAIGSAFRMLDIPVGFVYTSEICRAKEMAGIAFGRIDVEVPALNLCCIDGKPLDMEARNRYIEQSVALMPPNGKNTVIIAHGVGIVADLAQGEAAIYKPDGRGGTMRVAHVMPEEWVVGVYRADARSLPVVRGTAGDQPD
jgi:hypothetical protein